MKGFEIMIAPTRHLSSQFDSELNQVCAQVMEMGGLVESQIRQAIEALMTWDAQPALEVTRTEQQVNALEVRIDHALISIIGRRQPTARDLRLLMTFSKVTANLERIGDEAHKIARVVLGILDAGAVRPLPAGELRLAGEMAGRILRNALDALARLDTRSAMSVLRDDDLIDTEFDGFVRKLITFMMEDARTISPSLNLLFVAKAIERIGDHSKNVAEQIIYLVEGRDVRHQSMEAIEDAMQHAAPAPAQGLQGINSIQNVPNDGKNAQNAHNSPQTPSKENADLGRGLTAGHAEQSQADTPKS